MTEVLSCGHALVREEGSVGTGYGVDWDTGKKVCYACCGLKDEQQMMREGRITLYFSVTPKKLWEAAKTLNRELRGSLRYKITNWPGTLNIEPLNVQESQGVGFYGYVYPIWHFTFIGPDGYVWYGRCAGNSSEIAHCRRYKKQETWWATTHWRTVDELLQRPENLAA